jgi:hypothetical protein
MLATMTRTELMARLSTRAMKDGDFRQNLLSHPNRVLEREFGQKISPGITVKILQETDDTLYLVLPRAIAKTSAPSVPEKIFELTREPFAGTQSCNCTNAQTC